MFRSMFRSIPPQPVSSFSISRSLLALPKTKTKVPVLRFPTPAPGHVGQIKRERLNTLRPLFISKSKPFSTISSRLSGPSRKPKADVKRQKAQEERQKALNRKLESNPEEVTTANSIMPISPKSPKDARVQNHPDDDNMLRGLWSDLNTIKETFALKEVPREVYYIGIGGVIPYAAISFSTLYLAWDINYAQHNGMGYLINEQTAENLLHTLEPVQVGLGAVILSFLGAVHWGLEMAEYGGKHSYKRYALSVLAPVLAWPTVFLPFEYALITQFLGFTGMYFADSTATGWGWAPPWYMTYRFILTLVVGASIVTTLVGRGQIANRITSTLSPTSYLEKLRDEQWEHLANEEDERRRKLRMEGVEAKKKAREERSAKDRVGNGEVKGGDKGESENGRVGGEERTGEEKQVADPSKSTEGGNPGTQGYPDGKQGTSGAKGELGGSPEPTGEMKDAVKPEPERPLSDGMRG